MVEVCGTDDCDCLDFGVCYFWCTLLSVRKACRMCCCAIARLLRFCVCVVLVYCLICVVRLSMMSVASCLYCFLFVGRCVVALGVS